MAGVEDENVLGGEERWMRKSEWLGASIWTYWGYWETTGAIFFFFQAEAGIRGLERSRGFGDVYKSRHQG